MAHNQRMVSLSLYIYTHAHIHACTYRDGARCRAACVHSPLHLRETLLLSDQVAATATSIQTNLRAKICSFLKGGMGRGFYCDAVRWSIFFFSFWLILQQKYKKQMAAEPIAARTRRPLVRTKLYILSYMWIQTSLRHLLDCAFIYILYHIYGVPMRGIYLQLIRANSTKRTRSCSRVT